MDAEKIIHDLNRRFAAPLPEFYKRRIIFWYDEDKEFEDQIDGISLNDAKIVKLTGSNMFAVKKLLAMDDTASNYLVYCPITFERQEDDWLLNIELYSAETFRADLNTIWMDEMGLTASQMLRAQVKRYHKFFNSKERRAKIAAMAGSITTSAQMHLAVMAVICGVKDLNPNSIIRAVLKAGLDIEGNAAYRDIVKYGAQTAFWELINRATGYVYSDEPSFVHLAARILLTAATRNIDPDNLSGLQEFISVPHQAFCYDFVSDWYAYIYALARPSVRESKEEFKRAKNELRKVACAVEDELDLYRRFDRLDIDAICDTECFPCIDEVILNKLMTDINDQIIHVDDILSVIEKRRTAIWYTDWSCYYDGLIQVANMQKFYRAHAAGFHTAEAKDIWKEYTTDYYRMDSYYREFQLQFQTSLTSSNEQLGDLFKQVAQRVEALYSGWYLNELGSNWSNVAAEDLEKYGYIDGTERQEMFYRVRVQTCYDKKPASRVFVIISDALRYEVAASLTEQLRRETQSTVTLSSMCGIFPTITPYGMAALLPHKELSVQPKPNNNGLAVLADGQSTESTNRENLLKTARSASRAVQYHDFINMTGEQRKAFVKGMDVIYIYHDKIDEASHTSDSEVSKACNTTIQDIKDIVGLIDAACSSAHILITADHGFLYTYNPLTEDSKVSRDSWNGKDVEQGRRYVIMEKDAKPDYLMPVRFLGGKTDYAAFAPRENIRIKMSGGGLNFVHGGISLQEMVVPLIDYHYLSSNSAAYRKNRKQIDTKPVDVCLLSANRKISNMVFMLNFYQKEAVGDNREKANYMLYFTDSADKQVSDTARIIADKTNSDVQQRTFRSTFNLKSLSFDSKETYYLVIANEISGEVLHKEEFRIDIPFAVDEFNFF